MAHVEHGSQLTFAFEDIVNQGWTAGAHYYTNLFTALHGLDDGRAPRIVVVAPSGRRAGYDSYRALADEVIRRPKPTRKEIVRNQLDRVKRRVGVHAPVPLERLLREHGVDVMFACWTELGPSFGVPLLGWIPDFQHRHYPDFFSGEEYRHRDALFDRMSEHCTRIVLSSEDALRDFGRFISAFTDKARVLRFVAQVPDEIYDVDPRRVCDEYHLPERFLYLPNQFWVHKNHMVVLDALAELRATRPEITVVCTGNTSDNRDTLHFGKLIERVSRLGLRDNFIVLGWVSQASTFDLLRQSMAVLQPSLFEGWSTTVEEAKSIGKSIVLSDIPIHREQDPAGGSFFDPADPQALAQRLVEVYDTRRPGPDAEMESQARDALPGRTRAYAETFMDIALDAIAARSA